MRWSSDCSPQMPPRMMCSERCWQGKAEPNYNSRGQALLEIVQYLQLPQLSHTGTPRASCTGTWQPFLCGTLWDRQWLLRVDGWLGTLHSI